LCPSWKLLSSELPELPDFPGAGPHVDLNDCRVLEGLELELAQVGNRIRGLTKLAENQHKRLDEMRDTHIQQLDLVQDLFDQTLARSDHISRRLDVQFDRLNKIDLWILKQFPLSSKNTWGAPSKTDRATQTSTEVEFTDYESADELGESKKIKRFL